MLNIDLTPTVTIETRYGHQSTPSTSRGWSPLAEHEAKLEARAKAKRAIADTYRRLSN